MARALALVRDNRKEVTRFLKFMVVGIIGTIVDFGTLYLLHPVLGLHIVPSNTISFTAAVLSNFTWNRYWTYPDSRSKPVSRQAVQFALVNLIGLAIRTPIFIGVEPGMRRAAASLLVALQDAMPAAPWQSLPAGDLLGSNLALAMAVVVVLFWNFAVNRLWTYSDAP